MKKMLNIFAALTVLFLFSANANAQLEQGDFGIHARFDSDINCANILYVISPHIYVDAGVGLESVSYSVDEGEAPDSKTTMMFQVWGGYFFTKTDVSPFLGVGVSYQGFPDETTSTSDITKNKIAVEMNFGVNAFVTKKFAVYADIGVSYNMLTTNTKTNGVEYKVKENTFKMFTSAIGATFYF